MSRSTVYLGPGERLYYTPYKTPNYDPAAGAIDSWRAADITETTLDMTVANQEKQVVEAWVLQLVQRELGPALQEAEVEMKTRFAVSVDVAQASVITCALQKGAKERSGAAPAS
jgi:hypothetical protein